MRGLPTSAHATESRRFMPPEKRRDGAFAHAESATSASTFAVAAFIALPGGICRSRA